MKPVFEHSWELTPKEAVDLQRRLRERVVLAPLRTAVHRVAGIDVGFERNNTVTRAAVAVLSYPELQLVEHVIARQPTRFPYVPGLLSFREVPTVIDALAGLRSRPDILLCDGQGIAHPRRFGIASHLGVLFDVPTVGVAKTRLVGSHGEVPPGRGEWTPLEHHGEVIGAVLRSRAGVKPIYVSPGHRMDLDGAVAWTMACVTRYKLPETTRWAHRLASGPEGCAPGALG